MTFRLMFVAPLVLSTPFLAQQNDRPQQGPPLQNQNRMHHAPGADRPDQERRMDEREQMADERIDLDELGLPQGGVLAQS